MSKDRVVSTGSRIKGEGQRIKEIDTGLRIKGKTRGMKDSGVEWIGEIPEDWVVQNLKSILAERKENNNPIKTDFILSLTNDRGVIPYTEKGDIGNKSKDDLTGYKLAYPNDIVLNSMNVIIGSVGLSEYFGAVSPVYYMLYPRKEEDAVEFFNYVFQTKVFQESLKGYGNGIMEHRLRIPMINLNTVMLPYPTAKEQQKIVNFLDGKVSLIDDTIEKTKESIEEYEKYKQALITETVTKGLNPDVEMKQSGIEWVGEVPKHWRIIRIKHLATVNPNKSEIKHLSLDSEVTFIPMEKIIGPGQVDYSLSNTIENLINGYTYFKDGDIIMAKVTPCFENSNIAIVNGMKNGIGFGTTELHILRCNDKCYNKYLFYYLQSSVFVLKGISKMYGVGGLKRVSEDFVSNHKLAVPSYEEQKQIADYLDKKCSEIGKIISQKEQLIKELEDYKKSLIYEYVTGKKQV